MIKRLHHKFVIINMSIITIMMLIMVAVVLQMTKSGLERKSQDMMRQIAMNPIQPEIPEKDYSGVRLPYFVLEIDHTGEISVAGGDYYALSDAGFQQQVVDEVQKTDAKSGLLKQYGLRFFCVDTGQCERMVFADTSNEISTMNSLTGTCIMIFLGGFIIFLCISSFLAKWAVYPAETAWIQQKQFVADASHELRTPLTIILTNTELMCSPECSEEEKDCLAQNILTVSQQMRGLIAHGKLVAFDTPERLEKALTQTNKVELSTEASEKEVWEILSDISEVTSLVIKEAESGLTGVSLTLDASDPVGVCRRIFFAFAHAQRAVIQMTPVKADLEDIFIELTESDAPVGTSGKHRRT